MFRCPRGRVPAIVLAVLCLCVSGFAQESRATLTGRISDPNGAAVPGAKITITSQQTKLDTETTTNEEGNYTVPALQPGRYTVTVAAQGFKSASSDIVELHTADKATFDVTLEVGAVGDVVTVNAAAPLLEADTASRGGVVDRTRIVELPLSGRNPILLATLSPGVQFNGSLQFNRPFDNGDNVNFSINGGLNRHNEFLLDGAPNNAVTDVNANRTNSSNNIAFVPTPDATEEFKVQTNAYSAEYGRTGGGIVNISIRGGGPQVHGTLYDFLRRYQWDSNAFSNNANGRITSGPLAGQEVSPRFTRNAVTGAKIGGHELDQYGFLISGPVILPRFGEGGRRSYTDPNKTFFMFNLENYSEYSPTPGRTTVPTPLERQGDFSQSGVTIYDPLTTRLDPATGRFIRDPFPGNVIPANRINPVGQSIINAFDLPNVTGTDAFNRFGNFYNSQGSSVDNYHALITRVDHEISQNQRAFFRYIHSRRDQIAVGSNNREGLGADYQDPLVRTNNGAVLDYVATISEKTVLNARVGFNRFLQAALRNRSMPFNATQLGFPASFDAARPVPIVPRIAFGNDVSGIPSFGSRNPNSNITNTWSVPVNVTHVMGNHNVKLGAEYRNIQAHQAGGSFVFGGGFFCFTREFTSRDPQNPNVSGQGSAFAALLLGYPSAGTTSATQCNDNGATGSLVNNVSPLSFKWGYYAAYAQDDWKVTPKLTLNLGLRYDYESPPVEYHNRQNRGFAFNQASPLAASVRTAAGASECPACANLTGGLLFAGVGGQPEEAFKKDRNNFGPRFGVAYQLNEKTVLRGGYGLYYFPQAEYGSSFGFNVISQLSAPVGGGASQFIPTITLSNPFPTGLTQPVGATQGLSTLLGTGLTVVNPNHVIPYVHQYSAGLQRELPFRLKLDASYVGSRTRGILSGDQQSGGGLSNGRNLNVLTAQQLALVRSNNAFYTASVPNPLAGLVPNNAALNGATISRQTLLLPFPQYTGVTLLGENVGKLWYDSAQFSLEKRLSTGLVFTAAYTFSKTLGALGFLNNQDAEPLKSVVDFDTTHVFTSGGVYQLPFGRGRRFFSGGGLANAVLGGWEYNWLATFRSGNPINLPTNVDLIGDPTLENSSFERFFNGCVRQLDGTSRQPNAARTGFESCSNPVWAKRAANTLASTTNRLPNLRQPSAPIFDMSMNKTFAFNERYRLQFRAEAFNAFNTPLFGSPNTDVDSTNFGRLIERTSVRNENSGTYVRTIQFGLKFNF